MARRLHVPHLLPGEITLSPTQAHHARSVLRLPDGAAVELFDDRGNVAGGTLLWRGESGAAVRVGPVGAPAGDAAEWTVASAVPKGERADWMVEKLSELGTAAFVPLITARGVVLPGGRNKRERWVRIATESAKQSRRRGVMRVDELTPLADAVRAATARPEVVPVEAAEAPPAAAAGAPTGWYLCPAADTSAADLAVRPLPANVTVFVGPEGGWAEQELSAMKAAGLIEVRLTDSVLRVETAAVAAAAVLGILVSRARRHEPRP